MKDSTTLARAVSFLSGILFLFLLWMGISGFQQNEFIYPGIGKIFTAFIGMLIDQTTVSYAVCSFARVLLVLLISFLLCTALSFLYILCRNLYSFFRPLLVLLRATPLAIVSVYLWISLGSERAPYAITLLMVLPVMNEGFIAAIDNIDRAYILEMRTENVSLVRKFFRVYLPLIFPYIVMTLLQTFGLGIKVMLMGEYLCQSKASLGSLIYQYKQNLAFDSLLALLIYIVLIVFLLEFFVRKIAKSIK